MPELPNYWDHVRAHVARHAARWSCGSEGRLLFENLVANDDWQFRLLELAPENATDDLTPADTAAAVVTNYFSQAI